MITALMGAQALLAGIQDATARPVARWGLQVEPARCALTRLNPETGLTFSIDATPGSDNYRLAIKKDGIDAESFKPASLTFAPSQKVTMGLAKVAKLPNHTVLTLMHGLPASLLDDLSGASTVTLDVKGGAKSIVPVPGAAKAVEALRKCNADQLVEWGADPAQFALGGTTPTALKSRDEWILNARYLTLAKESARSTVNDNFRLLVSRDGVIAECHATAGITEKSLEKSACAAVVGRRLFNPAKDASGNAVVGAATFTISLLRRPS